MIFTKTILWLVVGAWHAVPSVVTEREAIAFEIAKIVGDIADKWGITIEGILVEDNDFSAEVVGSLSSAVQQKLVGESKVIATRAEADAARLMHQAADVLPSPAAMQIHQLEALQQKARSASSNVVCVPMQLGGDVAGQLAGKSSHTTSSSGAALNGECINAAGRAGLLLSVEYV